jgi:protein-S-isoprenylcysteine O-methyltransferase Ste14
VSEERGRGPGVRIPPPAIFVAGFLVGWLLDTWVYHLWPTTGRSASNVVDFIGGGVFGGGIALALSGAMTFRRAGTSVLPDRDASTLVRTGPYRATRNPIYMGMALAYVGLAILVGAGWPILILPLVIMAVQRLVIEREERYLTEAFGDEYRAYQKEVGRWW